MDLLETKQECSTLEGQQVHEVGRGSRQGSGAFLRTLDFILGAMKQ